MRRSTLARLFIGASVAVLATFLPQTGIAQAAPIALIPASCNGTTTVVSCAHREPGSGRFDVSFTGPSGIRALFGMPDIDVSNHRSAATIHSGVL
jgi:hypothetical protein